MYIYISLLGWIFFCQKSVKIRHGKLTLAGTLSRELSTVSVIWNVRPKIAFLFSKNNGKTLWLINSPYSSNSCSLKLGIYLFFYRIHICNFFLQLKFCPSVLVKKIFLVKYFSFLLWHPVKCHRRQHWKGLA